MKQIIIRMFVALIMCAVTSVIRFTSFMVISSSQQVHAESIWILRIILASVLSPILHFNLVHPTKASTPNVERFPQSL